MTESARNKKKSGNKIRNPIRRWWIYWRLRSLRLNLLVWSTFESKFLTNFLSFAQRHETLCKFNCGIHEIRRRLFTLAESSRKKVRKIDCWERSFTRDLRKKSLYFFFCCSTTVVERPFCGWVSSDASTGQLYLRAFAQLFNRVSLKVKWKYNVRINIEIALFFCVKFSFLEAWPLVRCENVSLFVEVNGLWDKKNS